jgi:outer membrane protein assembly factor BamB
MSTNENTPFTPDNVDEQVEQSIAGNDALPSISANETPARQTVQALQQYYAPNDENNPSLQRVWNRFVQSRELMETVTQKEPAKQRSARILPFRRYSTPLARVNVDREHRSPSRIATIASIVFLAAVLGSAVVVFQAVRYGRTATTTHLASCTTTRSNARVAPTHPTQMYTETEDTVYRLDPVTHRPLWRFSMHPVGGYGHVQAQGQVIHNVFYAFGSDTDGYYYYALNTSDGSLRWRFKLGDTSQLAVTGRQLVVNGVVYISQASIASGYSTITALDASTGHIQWQHRYERTGVATEQKHNTDFATGLGLQAATSTMLITTSSTKKNGIVTFTLSAINANNGSLSWQTTTHLLDYIGGGAQVTGSTIYVTLWASSNENYVRAYNVQDGSQRWSVQVQGQPSYPVVSNGVVYIGTTHDTNASGGSVYALKSESGSTLWVYEASGEVSVPLVENGVLYMSAVRGDGSQHTLTALDTGTGTLCWSRSTPDTFMTGTMPITSGNLLYLGTSGNRVNVFNLSDGTLVSTFTVPGVSTFPDPTQPNILVL